MFSSAHWSSLSGGGGAQCSMSPATIRSIFVWFIARACRQRDGPLKRDLAQHIVGELFQRRLIGVGEMRQDDAGPRRKRLEQHAAGAHKPRPHRLGLAQRDQLPVELLVLEFG